MESPPPAVFHDKYERTQQGNLLQKTQIIWVCPDIWVFQYLHNRHLSDIWVICQKCQFELRKDCSLGQRLRTSIVKSLFIVCQRHGFLAQPGVLGIMCFTHCPGSIRTNTRFCRETNNVVNMRFVGLFWTQTLSHLRAFVANQVCRDNAFFWVCFVQTFTQTLRILLRFCADICPKNWRQRPLVYSFRRVDGWMDECSLRFMGVNS